MTEIFFRTPEKQQYDQGTSAYVTLKKEYLHIREKYWAMVVGSMITLHGGTEIHVCKDQDGEIGQIKYIKVSVHDIYYPPVCGYISAEALKRCNKVKPGSGARESGTPKPCGHAVVSNTSNCMGCWWRWWRIRVEQINSEQNI